MNTTALFEGNVVIVAQSLFSRVAEKLEAYLRNKANKLVYIGLSAVYHKDTSCNCVFYKKGKISWKSELPPMSFPISIVHVMLTYFIDTLFTFFSLLHLKTRFDVYIGIGSFNAFLGLILQKLGIVRNVISYDLDYFLSFATISRSFGKILLEIHHKMMQVCNNSSCIVWNVTPALIEIKKREGIIIKGSSPQIVFQDGVDSRKVKHALLQPIEKDSIGFIGAIRPDHGLELAIDALPDVIKKVPDVKLKIIGTGPHEKILKNLVKKRGLVNHVHFFGFIRDEYETYNILSKCACAIAPFTPNSHARYGEPGKLKTYMECGLPMIVTNVPLLSKEIKENKAGIVINYDKKELANAIIEMLTDEQKSKQFRRNVVTYASTYFWEELFKSMFNINRSTNGD